jgi:hypothetical protein
VLPDIPDAIKIPRSGLPSTPTAPPARAASVGPVSRGDQS